MTRLTECARRHPLALTAAAAGLGLLLFASLEYGPANSIGGPVALRPSAAFEGAADTREIALFDTPRALPAIHFADGDGRALSLADFSGRVVLLNLWATWCVPCRKEMPTLDRLQGKLRGNRFIVIPLSIDRGGAAAVKGFYQQIGVEQLGIYVDPSGRAPAALAAPGLPTTLLIDGRGREIARKLGEAEWDGQQMTGLVAGAIAAEPVQ